MLSKLRTEGMAVEDGPRLSGCCVSLESMLHPPRHRRSRKLPAPGTNPLSHLGTVAAFPFFPMPPPTATPPIVGEGSRHCRTAHTALYGSSLPTTSFD